MRRLVLITGATSGIGLAFARVYASHGWDVVVTGRRQERLEKLVEEIRLRFGVEAHFIAADLAEAGTPQKLVDFVTALGRKVDGLVNNAGYGLPEGFVGNDFAAHETFMRVLMQAPTELAHLVLPGMIEQKFGRIINVASLASYLPASPGDTLYAPAKAYLTRFSQGLHLEARDHNVHVSALCPGYTYSEFHDVTGSRRIISQNTPEWMWMGADEVAREGYQAAEANRAICVPGAPNKFLSAVLKILPDDWSLELISNQLRRMMR
ncbi:SDR family oxidoreductase [Asticcacaulis sp. BYS171W]|uniref:SDR family oxidoreductase n=1 Tax=Asticcacaulis aquaticus TaxID=2984212 RepID=A0ABT5HSJ0_9CAUL|nr:SDR family oxidoreductase [Asticcacaulis aquaticus]MDC7683021.1 SDR family oxidoreductase [Asticcacaulis aquaticus]